MRLLIIVALLAAIIASGAGASAQSTPKPALPACAAGDPVVWLNTSSNVYHMQGTKYYGNTKQGKYLCKSQAERAGAHQAKAAGPAMISTPSAMATPAPGATKTPKPKKTPKPNKAPAPGTT